MTWVRGAGVRVLLLAALIGFAVVVGPLSTALDGDRRQVLAGYDTSPGRSPSPTSTP